MEWIIAVLAGAATGVLSGLGVGGGSLLLIYLTNFTGAAQNLAQGINLLYFLPAAAKYRVYIIDEVHMLSTGAFNAALVPAICAGLVCSALAAWAATAMDVGLLRKCFGGFLLVIGLRELFREDKL